jgi:6,7-dimethyl-8-ribityllumazine synthase
MTVRTATIISGDFHENIAKRMIEAAITELKTAGVATIETITVAGSYEIPIVTDKVLLASKPDIVVVLGYIEKGETLHGEVMGQVVYSKLLDLQLKYGIPIGLGIIGPGATPEQAEVRLLPAAQGAVQAALRTHDTLQNINI